MKIKLNTLTILGAATATVIILAVAINQIQIRSSQTANVSDKFRFDKVTEESVTKIEIIKKTETITLNKVDGNWKVGELDANASSVSSFINLVKDATIDATVSTNSENHSSFEVDSETGVTVKFYKNGDNLIEQFIVGKYANGGKCYVRKVDGNNVYAVNGNLSGYTEKEVEDWMMVEETATEEVAE